MTSRKKPAPAANPAHDYRNLSTKVGRGLDLSIEWAMDKLQDPASPDWAKAQAMTFFAKLQHFIVPAEVGQEESPMDHFLKVMSDIRHVPIPSPTPPEPEPDEDEDDRAVFEASAS